MTYLELLRKLHTDCGAAGQAPSAVTNLTGEAARLAGWIRDANTDVQNLWENWKFLRRTDSRALTPASNVLAAPTDMGDGLWDDETFYVLQVGDTVAMPLLVAEYDEVKTELVDVSPGPPWRAVIMPNNSLRFEGTPNTADTFTADYYREPDPDELTANADESSIPSRFHRVILGRALILYANFEGAEEVKTQGLEIYTDYLARLENSQLPNQRKARYRTGGHFTVTPQ